MRTLSITCSGSKPYRFEPPFEGGEYALLLYVAADDVSPEEQTRISAEIVASGCRYVVCFGNRCSSWDDSIDLASVYAGKEEEGFVMTTWHADDTPEDVAFFFWHNTSFGEFSAARMGALFIGCNPRVEAALRTALTALHENG